MSVLALPQYFLTELTARTDLVALAGQYTALTLKGGVWVGLCPFHSEKTPSFNLSRDNTMYYCFGCGAGGGAVQFLMQAENMEFIDAVRELALRAGMDMPEEEERRGIRRARLLEINKLAARWFFENLSRPAGEAALAYMRSRGLSSKTARRFGLGAAPDEWDALARHLEQSGLSREELTESGLAALNNRGGLTDAFRDRLMFPIFDPGGQVIAFSGRALKDGVPNKYKNSRETGVYIKSRTLYGLNYAKNSSRPYFILVEGNVDVPMLHQHGFDSACATCGTALTDAQAGLMAKYKREVVLAYDSDEAGRTATQKAMKKLETAGLKIRILALSGAKDPDEYLKRYGPGAMEALLTGAENHMNYRLESIAAQFNLESDDGRRDFLRKAEEMLLDLNTEAERQIYASRVAERADVSREAVLRDLDAARTRKHRKAAAAEERALIYPKKPSGGIEEDILMHMARAEEYATRGARELAPSDFTDPARERLFTAMTSPEFSPAALDAPEAALLAKLKGGRPAPYSAAGEVLSDESWRSAVRRLRETGLKRAKPASDQDLLTLRETLKEKYGG
ncbi:MAG: DNA primase [Oscillospiraceae bacterium]|nr:DNA primase [Oscillospiraceae bacterium]